MFMHYICIIIIIIMYYKVNVSEDMTRPNTAKIQSMKKRVQAKILS